MTRLHGESISAEQCADILANGETTQTLRIGDMIATWVMCRIHGLIVVIQSGCGFMKMKAA